MKDFLKDSAWQSLSVITAVITVLVTLTFSGVTFNYYAVGVAIAISILTVIFQYLSSKAKQSEKSSGRARIEKTIREMGVEGISLARKTLVDLDLSKLDLSKVNAAEANLAHSDLSGSFLTSANLQKADLQAANLRMADLSFADLRDANLDRANLEGANLKGANLQGAILENTIIRNILLQDTLYDDSTQWSKDFDPTLVPGLVKQVSPS